MIKLKLAFFSSTLFLAILLFFYIVHIHYFLVDVVFYSAMLDGLLAAVLATIVICLIKTFELLNWFEKTQLVIIWLLIGYALAISVPTVLDRSLSFYILEKLDQRGGGIKLTSFEQIFTTEYVREHRLVDVRLTEQRASGTIILENNCVKLTKRGRGLARWSRYFRKNFLPKHRLLMGEYTDELTDLYRHSDGAVPNYVCD